MSVDSATRLAQLDGLLESKNANIRNEAASAFGKFSIYDENVIRILKKQLTSQSWESRVAAGKALQAVLNNSHTFELTNTKKEEGFETTQFLEELKTMVVKNILSRYKPLLGDSETSLKNDSSCPTTSRKQRELIDQHLEYNSFTGISSKKFLTDDELNAANNPVPSTSSDDQASEELSQVVKKEEPTESEVVEQNLIERQEQYWKILSEFVNLVTDPRWYTRHGSAIAVCQIATTSFHRLSNNLIDSCLYLFIQVLILDKFNDFISGRNATAPVREQCAQAVVHMLRNVDETRREVVLQLIVQMMNTSGEDNWNVRQSGLLVMKYYFAIANNDGQKETFDRCFDLVIESLNDTVDDVTGSAVKTLSSILANQSIPREEMSRLVEKVMIHVWRLLQTESTKEQLRAGLDALCIDLLEIVEMWLGWNASSSLSRENLLIVCSMIDVSYPVRCEKIVKLLDADLDRGNTDKLNADDVFLLTKQLYRILLFAPPADTLVFIERAFLTFQKLFRSYKSIMVESGHISQKIGIWTGCLLFDHRNPMIDVFEHSVDGISSDPKSPCERMCSEEVRFLNEKEKDSVYLTRKILCAKFLATILEALYETDLEMGGQKVSIAIQLIFVPYFQSNSVMHNLGASIVVNEWAALYRNAFNAKQTEKEAPMTIVQLCDAVLRGPAKQYNEMATSVNMLTKDCNEFIEYCSIRGFNQSTVDMAAAESIEEISKRAYSVSRETLTTDKQRESMDTRYNILMRTIESVKMIIKTNATRINSLLASALFYFGSAPEKLTPQIRPLVETMQYEENDAIASEIFRGGIPLLVVFSWSRNPKPYVKVIAKAVESFASCSYRIPKPVETPTCTDNIISYARITGKEEEDEKEKDKEDGNRISYQSKNAELVMMILCRQFSTTQLPEFFANFDLNEDVDQLTLLTRLEMHECFWNCVGSRLSDESTNKIFQLLSSNDPTLRFAASKAIETFLKSQCGDTISRCYDRLVKMAENLQEVHERLGACEALLRIASLDSAYINGLATLLCPVVFRLLADKCETIRDAAGETFRKLVPMVTIEDPNFKVENLSEELSEKKEQNKNFIIVLGSPNNLPRIARSVIRGGFEASMLREYQLEGITWLRFLRHYGLNGILADDMGLGKTLQTMCAISMSLDLDNLDPKERCSLIVCPRTLVDHWCLEWKRYFPQREMAVKQAAKITVADICVVAYEDLKSNQFIQQRVWNYVVLDEGHVMRNPKTQVWKSANALTCRSRLILSGTPVQNSPADLWALFTWLMPGYLGTEKQFRSQFLKKILKCRLPKANEADLKAGSAALSHLHKLILPFVMRRLKCDVLKELPDKNVQDYECELSHEQREIYRYLVDKCTSDSSEISAGKGINALHTLISLRKLVDHPMLVYETLQKLNAPDFIMKMAKNSKSGKLEALGQLLIECGICKNPEVEESDDAAIASTSSSDSDGAHRALIFCQWKVSAKLVSKKLSNGEFGSPVSHLVLDGNTPPNDRIKVVNRFNEDKTIEVLVLTTHIGGVGLNLTGADTVIFLDHDWNPMKDLQAIDRAHRLGQTRKVNVYRLITQGTVEEKVMSLAKFKLNTAQALISDDNTSLQSMQTSELMEMFTLDGDEKASAKVKEPPTKRQKKGAAAAAGIAAGTAEEWNLAEMWDDSQYDDFQVDNFLKNQ